MTIAVLSWGAHKTLINTLDSYQKHGLDDAEKIIFFQEISTEDTAIAKDYGYESLGTSENIGIGPATQILADAASGDFFLFLENDWKCIADAQPLLAKAKLLIVVGITDCVKLRHRKEPGHPLWSRQFAGHEYDRPDYLLDSVHWEDHPEKFSDIQKMGEWYVTTSEFANFTNNPTLYQTAFFREYISPKSGAKGRASESEIQDWWRTQRFKVAQGEGLFTHHRLD